MSKKQLSGFTLMLNFVFYSVLYVVVFLVPFAAVLYLLSLTGLDIGDNEKGELSGGSYVLIGVSLLLFIWAEAAAMNYVVKGFGFIGAIREPVSYCVMCVRFALGIGYSNGDEAEKEN